MRHEHSKNIKLKNKLCEIIWNDLLFASLDLLENLRLLCSLNIERFHRGRVWAWEPPSEMFLIEKYAKWDAGSTEQMMEVMLQ